MNLKNFVGEHTYNTIKNFAVDGEAIKKALVTPQNARNVFSELDEFQIKSLCTEISNSGTIGTIKNATQEEIIKMFNQINYDTVIFDNEDAIRECKKYYKSNETICTYNDLQGRMREYHMIVAIKSNIDKIERSNIPQRDDEYGTSILNIQIARNGSHMSIKNRYNHTVSQPDSTLNNNLDILHFGLQSAVLGYYGFASLSNKKSHYPNIINIAGIYLKYHTEKNNVYFGAFTLDGVNGIRFEDTSRYYITKDNISSGYYRTPLVLDFKNKEVIDITEDKEKRNGKAILLSNAIKNNILTSENKNETDTLTAIFSNAKFELLKCRSKALKYIHEIYGYDFTKPYTVTAFLGKFTAKSIEKVIGNDNAILLSYYDQEMKVCEMNSGKFNAKDLKSHYNYYIGTFYGQTDFDTKRKSGSMATYVIHQDKEYIGKPKTKVKNSYSLYQNRNNDIIDKSGYNLTEIRNQLQNRLRIYKANKRAKEASEIDYTQDILEIEKMFSETKNKLVMLFTKAETFDEYNKVESVMGYKLKWLVNDINSLKKNAKEKNFTSVQSAQEKINAIKETINVLDLKCGE